MRAEETSSTPARILYRPWGLVLGVVAGMVAGRITKQVFGRVTAGPSGDVPQALESEYSLPQVVSAALIQGAVFAGVKAAVDRGGARLFQRWTGEWPGN